MLLDVFTLKKNKKETKKKVKKACVLKLMLFFNSMR